MVSFIKGGLLLPELKKGGVIKKGGPKILRGDFLILIHRRQVLDNSTSCIPKFLPAAPMLLIKNFLTTYHREFPKIFEIFLVTNAKRFYG